jgi:hypothetical protein
MLEVLLHCKISAAGVKSIRALAIDIWRVTMAQVSNRAEAAKAGEHAKEQANKTQDLAKRGAEAARDSGEPMLEAVRDAAEETCATGSQVLNETRSAMGRGFGAAAETARRTTERAAPASREALAAESELMGSWLELGRDQVEHNLETLRRLASIRDVRELAELQQEYVRRSLARATQLFSRQVGVASRLFAAGRQTVDRQP